MNKECPRHPITGQRRPTQKHLHFYSKCAVSDTLAKAKTMKSLRLSDYGFPALNDVDSLLEV